MTGRRPTPNPDMLTARDVAGLLAVSKMTVYRLANSGELPAYRVGRSIRVHRRDFEAYVAGAWMGGAT